MPDLTILTWLWRQKSSRCRYTAEHVNTWAAMVRRHVTIPHRIACVTDMPDGICSSIKIIPLPDPFPKINNRHWKEAQGLPQCYRRLDMYRPDAADIYGERFVSMDLDCVVLGSLDPIFDRKEDFVIYRGTSGKRPYNGSMQMLTAGARPQVFTKFTSALAERASALYVGSDQAWISYALGWLEATWGSAHGVDHYRSKAHGLRGLSNSTRLLFFPGPTKPWDKDPQRIRPIRSNYRG